MNKSRANDLAKARNMITSAAKHGSGVTLRMSKDLFDLLASELQGSAISLGPGQQYIGQSPGINELHFNMYNQLVIVKPLPATHQYFQDATP